MKKTVGFLFLWVIIACQAGTIYVDGGAGGTNNGASWIDAYNFLQDGLGAAVSGDTILVAQGIYTPDTSTASPGGTGARTATFTLKNGVTIRGGYAGTGQADPDARDIVAFETILSGDLNGDDGPDFANNSENSYHVVIVSSTDATANLGGFTITGGNANLSDYSGGALYNDSGSPTIVNCRIAKNYSDDGGAFYNNDGNPTLTDCIFVNNKTKYNAGALYNSGTSGITLTRCVFLNNVTTKGNGGAIFHSGSGGLTAIDVLFAGNATNSGGGGIYAVRAMNLTNCAFTGNSARRGGGIHTGGSLTLTNCTFSINTTTYYPDGAGLYTRDNTTVINNCIFWDNYRSALPGDEDDQISYYNCSLQINYTCVQTWSGAMGGVGNIGSDPLFVDADGFDDIAGTEDDDLRLPLGVSPCVDAGDNTAVPSGIVTDIAGNPRFYDDPGVADTGFGSAPIVDMGVYEAFPPPQPQIGVSPNALDFKTIEGYVNPDSQTFSIYNQGEGTLHWEISEDCLWLQTFPLSGSSTGETDIVTVNIDNSTLSAGFYECEVMVCDSNAINSPQSVSVTLDVVPPWKHQIDFPDEPFQTSGLFAEEPGWVKFTIKTSDPNTVYFQDCRDYLFHYDWATVWLEPFIGMSSSEYNTISLYAQGQQAALGTVIIPADPDIQEYGIQFIRYDAYTKEEIADMFFAVKDCIDADPGVEAFYFPSYEQMTVAETNRTWFEAQGIPVGSTARWAQGNACYSSGWALGTLKYFAGSEIQAAYTSGQLLPEDILLTDGVPAEVPFVAGILSLSPSTPSSHVAILAQTFGIPFGHLALAEDADLAQQLVSRFVLVCVGEEEGVGSIGLKDMTGLLTPGEIEQILALKAPSVLDIAVMEDYGSYSGDADVLVLEDIRYFGGKAANYGLLRQAIPDHCPKAAAFSFDVWNEFLDQPLTPGEGVIIDPNGYVVFWADDQTAQGPTHTSFRLSKDGEDIGLFDVDGSSLIDGLSFTGQTEDVSFGRSPDGADTWMYFSGGDVSPSDMNPGSGDRPAQGLFINEFMADNDAVAADEYGDYDDWIEIYNAGPTAVDLGGMYLTDDLDDPTKFMISVGITGSTLREEIANRLSGYTYPPSNLAALSADLAAIRNMIINAGVTHFSPQLQDVILTTLQDPNYGFDPASNLRFRSSTNVEDANQFSGAGLYDSYSGCLADDIDGDSFGPCACDMSESNERGVFRAIRKVFASFYNENAFLERLRHGIDEDDVGMGLLVHHSVPDAYELANGVATLERRSDDTKRYLKLVTQKGAVSVANPEDGSIPEEVTVVYTSESQIEMTLVRASNLVVLGETVLDWPADYNDLSGLLVTAAEEFEATTGKTDYVLDFEYKKLAPGGAAIPGGGLEIKQIREIPKFDQSMTVNTPFLVNEPVTYVTFQGEMWGDVYAKHRLKCRCTLSTKNMWLTPENLAEGFYHDMSLEYAADGRIRTLTGRTSEFPYAGHTFVNTTATDSWMMHHVYNPRTYTLTTSNIKTQVGAAESPVVTLSDFGQLMQEDLRFLSIRADYALPGEPTTDNAGLCPELMDYLYQQRSYSSGGVSVTTSYYYALWESMILTYPLSHFIETTITGLTTQPIVLHGYFSQTFHPHHHNFGEDFLFEPRLEPGISQSILDELEAAKIHLVYAGTSGLSTLSSWDEAFLTSDIDDDGQVNISDLMNLSSRWLDRVCDECAGADLTGDGRVNMDDLCELAGEWLATL